MGTPKADLEWHGSTLLRRTVAILARATDGPVVVVRASGQPLPALPAGTIVVDDPRAGKGPVQGIAAALAALEDKADTAFVTSTDLPFLHPAFIRAVLRALDAPENAPQQAPHYGPDHGPQQAPHHGPHRGPDVALPVARGYRQPLAAAYRTGLAGLAERLVKEERLRPAFLFHECSVTQLDDAALLADPAIAALDPGLDSLLNVNTPGEYRAARGRPAPAVTVGLPADLAQAGPQGGGSRVVRAATVREAAAAIGLPPAPNIAATLNHDQETRDPECPLVAGDTVLFAGSQSRRA
jgi:molybdopterin-guanine dinucleotide biosynthesis protein A